MSTLILIDTNEAPQPPKRSTLSRTHLERQAFYDSAVLTMTQPKNSKKVGKFSPDEGDSLTSIILNLSHASKRVGASVDAWKSPEDNAVYFKVVSEDEEVAETAA